MLYLTGFIEKNVVCGRGVLFEETGGHPGRKGKHATEKSTFLMGVGIGAIVLLGLGFVWWTWMAEAFQAVEIMVYKSPSCQCCGQWVEHLEKNCFRVTVENVNDMHQVKKRLGVPDHLSSCHTGLMGSYVVEGHVPASDLQRLFREKPSVKGMTVPGMPIGSPGMEIPGDPPDRYDVLTYTQDGQTRIFSQH